MIYCNNKLYIHSHTGKKESHTHTVAWRVSCFLWLHPEFEYFSRYVVAHNSLRDFHFHKHTMLWWTCVHWLSIRIGSDIIQESRDGDGWNFLRDSTQVLADCYVQVAIYSKLAAPCVLYDVVTRFSWKVYILSICIMIQKSKLPVMS